MKTVVLLSLLMACISLSGCEKSIDHINAGRYVAVSPAGVNIPVLYVIDTATGQVWRSANCHEKARTLNCLYPMIYRKVSPSDVQKEGNVSLFLEDGSDEASLK